MVSCVLVARGDLGELGLDRVGDLDGVRVGRLGDRQRQRLVAVGPREPGRGDGSRPDGAEVADGDRRRGDGSGHASGPGTGAALPAGAVGVTGAAAS